VSSEVRLVGGDMNLVVRVGDTVRRPPEPPGVQALLRWFDRVGFDGAPRFLGIDEQGREMLSFVEGDPGFAPVPSSDEVVAGIGRLLRQAHDAQAGFEPPDEPGWLRPAAAEPEVIGHTDLYWTNVIFRGNLPAAFIDWEMAAPVTRALEVALAATWWAGTRIDDQLLEWGLPLGRRGERLRILCDAYGLDRSQRASLLPELIAHRRSALERGVVRGSTLRETIVANLRWTEDNAAELGTFLA
jgi:Phosphotransferase enzyme family